MLDYFRGRSVIYFWPLMCKRKYFEGNISPLIKQKVKAFFAPFSTFLLRKLSIVFSCYVSFWVAYHFLHHNCIMLISVLFSLDITIDLIPCGCLCLPNLLTYFIKNTNKCFFTLMVRGAPQKFTEFNAKCFFCFFK